LAENVLQPDEVTPDIFGNPTRIAWSVLVGSFIVFCLICTASTLGTYYYFFESSVTLTTALQVGSGTIGVREANTAEQTATGLRYIDAGTTVRTDQTNTLSQASITFRDPNNADRAVSVVTVKGDSSVQLLYARRPRFRWGTGLYRIHLGQLSGEIDVTVADELIRDVELVISSSQGHEVRILESGRYLVEGTADQLILTNRDGVAIMLGEESVPPRSIPIGGRGVYDIGEGVIEIGTAFDNLTVNSELQVFRPGEADIAGNEYPSGWVCSNDLQNEISRENRLPKGNHRFEISPDGRESFRLVREGANNNVATGCRQNFGDDDEGIDVTQYNELFVQMTLYVDSQSLSGCGQAASECPLMVRIIFEDLLRDEQGNILTDEDDQPRYQEREFIQGVYGRLDPMVPWALRCGTCFQDHVRIYPDAWYIYDSGDLFDFFPSGERPERVKSIEFYASGHNYDVYVNEVALLARQQPMLDETVNAQSDS